MDGWLKFTSYIEWERAEKESVYRREKWALKLFRDETVASEDGDGVGEKWCSWQSNLWRRVGMESYLTIPRESDIDLTMCITSSPMTPSKPQSQVSLALDELGVAVVFSTSVAGAAFTCRLQLYSHFQNFSVNKSKILICFLLVAKIYCIFFCILLVC